MAFDKFAFDIGNLVLSGLNFVTHLLGICLLSTLYRYQKNAQWLMVIHLSVAELFTTIVRALVIILYMIEPPVFGPPPGAGGGGFGKNMTGNRTVQLPPSFNKPGSTGPAVCKPPPWTDIRYTANYMTTFSMTGCFFVVFLIMMTITIDRMCLVLLKSTYHKVFSIFNTKIILACIWIIGAIMLITFPVVHYVHCYNHSYHFEYHIYLVCDVVFMVFAALSVLVVFMKYRGYQTYVDGEENTKKSAFTDSTFYIPLLIMFTYFAFVVLPHWVYVGRKYAEGYKGRDHWYSVMVLLLIGYWSDAIVYVFLQPPVRKLLGRWLTCKGCAPQIAPQKSHHFDSEVVVNKNAEV